MRTHALCERRAPYCTRERSPRRLGPMRPSAPHLCAPLASHAASSPGVEATRCGGNVRTRGQLAARVAALACALRGALGVRDGDVVALAAQSTDALLEAWLAVAAAGAIAAPLNPRWCAVLARNAHQAP